ncbi:PDZ domain-containing protein [Streptomyces sp. HUAS ZL42]|uniref:PDZ domain-containing protein n=1 Tax=Streptomyces sp. HUAS ZL42 TaxID=3231715 RepID=UPI00345EC7E8
MEQTALKPKALPKPTPGREPGNGTSTDPRPPRRPHAARRRGRRLTSLLFGLFVGTVLVLSGVGLGTVGATVIGLSKVADLQKQPRQPAGRQPPAPATLGVEVADAGKPGALIVGVHRPGPGHSVGLVRGDVLLAFGGTRIDSATDLARAVSRTRPGEEITLTVRHRAGDYEQLTVVPGVVT